MTETEEPGAPPVILLVEDDASHCEAMSRVLLAHGGYELRFATTLADAQRAIAREKMHLVLADLNLADGQAFELLPGPGEEATLPVLVLTSHGDERAAVRAMRRGALDYVVKSSEAFHGLPRTVDRALREWRLIESRRAAEVALRDSEERFRVLFESSPDACWIASVDGKYLEINRAAEDLLGYGRRDVIGRAILDTHVIRADCLGAANRMLAHCASGSPSPITELVIVHRTGREITIEARVTPVRFKNGSAILTAARDITERKDAELEQRRLEDQLRQASKMEAVGRLAGGVAHDFNNLLTGIRGFTDILLSDPLTGEGPRADLLEIQRATQRAAELTGQLLAFSRKQVVDPVVVDLNQLLLGAMRIVERLIGEDVHLVFKPGIALRGTRVDPSAIEQVLINLAINARDAMPGGGQLRIETAAIEVDASFCARHLDARPGSYVLLAVTDNGAGMSEGVLSHLFEPFFTTKGPGRGTGLGLSIIYGIVQQSGGFVHVESGLGAGSTFRIYLPSVREAPVVPVKHAEPELPRGTETILVVEDEVLVRGLVGKFLRSQGYHVLSSARGAEAVELARGHVRGIDLLLSDVILPHMNGRQIYDSLASSRPSLRVLFMSGHTEQVVASHGVLEGGFHFVQKPFSLKELARKVREALDHH